MKDMAPTVIRLRFARVRDLILFLFFLFLFADQHTAARENLATVHTLDNGLRVLIIEKHTTPVVAVQVWYRVGSMHEKERVRGIAHLFEHMMFRGSEHFGPEEHHRLVNEVGGDTNAYTFFDRTVYHQCLPAGELERVLRLEADRMNGLKLSQDMLDTEREVVLEEWELRMNDPFFELLSQALDVLYPNHPFGLTPLGRVEDIEGFSLQDCRDFYDSYYAPNNAVLIVVGDVDRAGVTAMCERYFGGIPAATIPERPDLSLEPSAGAAPHKLEDSIPLRVTLVAYRIPEAGHPDVIPLRILAQILSSGESSRLSRSLVREQELAVAALGYPIIVRGPGLFACAAIHFPNISSKKVERAVCAEVDRFIREDVAKADLEKARKQLLADRVFGWYSAEDIANGLGFAEVVQGDYRLFEEEVAALNKVTAADIRRVAGTYFSETDRIVIYFQPKWNPIVWLYGVAKSLFR